MVEEGKIGESETLKLEFEDEIEYVVCKDEDNVTKKKYAISFWKINK